MSEPNYPGCQKLIRWTVTDETVDPPQLADPSLMVLYAGASGATPTVLNYPDDAAIVRDSIGAFHALVTCDRAGEWAAFVKALEGVVASGVIKWDVDSAPFPQAT